MVVKAVSRIVYLLAVLLAVETLVFGLVHLAGDPLDALVPPGSSPEDVYTLRRKFGLDDSLTRQYLRFVTNAARGDFGISWRYDRPASDVLLDRLPQTLELAVAAFLLALMVAVPLGLAAGARRGCIADGGSQIVALAGQAIPGFWLGTLLILAFSVHLNWLPSSGNASFDSAILPVITLAAYPAAVLTRMLRASVQEAMALDYVRTARAKGLRQHTILAKHVLRNAVLPVIAYGGVVAGFMVTGAVVVEWVFAWPGAGQLALQSVSNRDVPVVLMFVTVSAVIIVLSNQAADLLALVADPRLRDRQERALGWSG